MSQRFQSSRRAVAAAAGGGKDLRHSVTTEVEIDDTVYHLWTYDQLEGLTNAKLLQRCRDFRDKAEATLECPRIPRQSDAMIRWIIDLQCKLSGQNPWDFGCPETVYDIARDRSPFRIRPDQKFPHLYAEDRVASFVPLGERRLDGLTYPTEEAREGTVRRAHGSAEWIKDHLDPTAQEANTKTRGRLHASPTKEGWHDHITGDAAVEREEARGRRHVDPDADAWRDHFEEDGLPEEQERGRRLRRFGSVQEGWHDHIKGGEGDEVEAPVGRRAAPEGEDCIRDHILEDELQQGSRRFDAYKDEPIEPEHKARGMRHARPTVEGWHDHVFGNTSRVDLGQRNRGRKAASPETEGWKDHFENDGVPNVDETVHGRKHADASTEGWSDHIKGGTVGYGRTEEEGVHGRKHAEGGEGWIRDHMLNEGEADDGKGQVGQQGRKRADQNAGCMKDHIQGDTTRASVVVDRPHGRGHAGAMEEGWKDHIHGWTTEDQPEQVHGRMHGTAAQEGWTDHLAGGVGTVDGKPEGRRHPSVSKAGWAEEHLDKTMMATRASGAAGGGGVRRSPFY
ncbi:hypothetical protein FOL47_003376 [Perkinsus chesapeaki]|uniref:Uncharacterized protein n=1 Tax=Perkinsus chesapeaki TaxID=330153 RepID=A0A7J6M8J5_PERCH|nr:hypothetical protein FOL47_003376 [Perkinsus chesapeaki]